MNSIVVVFVETNFALHECFCYEPCMKNIDRCRCIMYINIYNVRDCDYTTYDLASENLRLVCIVMALQVNADAVVVNRAFDTNSY